MEQLLLSVLISTAPPKAVLFSVCASAQAQGAERLLSETEVARKFECREHTWQMRVEAIFGMGIGGRRSLVSEVRSIRPQTCGTPKSNGNQLSTCESAWAIDVGH